MPVDQEARLQSEESQEELQEEKNQTGEVSEGEVDQEQAQDEALDLTVDSNTFNQWNYDKLNNYQEVDVPEIPVITYSDEPDFRSKWVTSNYRNKWANSADSKKLDEELKDIYENTGRRLRDTTRRGLTSYGSDRGDLGGYASISFTPGNIKGDYKPREIKISGPLSNLVESQLNSMQSDLSALNNPRANTYIPRGAKFVNMGMFALVEPEQNEKGEYTVFGRTQIPVFNADGTPKWELDKNNKPIPRRKHDGTILRDSNGNIKYRQAKEWVVYDTGRKSRHNFGSYAFVNSSKLDQIEAFADKVEKYGDKYPEIKQYKKFFMCIADQESAYKLNAHNKDAKNGVPVNALGLFQILHKNLPGLGIKATIPQFLASEDLQFKAAAALARDFLNTLGPRRIKAANQDGFSTEALLGAAWMSGASGTKKLLDNATIRDDKSWSPTNSGYSNFQYLLMCNNF